MTRRYDVRTGMLEQDPDAGQPREQLVPGWRVPGHSRYDYDLRIGDAERDAAMAQLREHFVAGRLTFDELTERIDLALTAKTQGHINRLMADLPGPPRPARPEPARYEVLAQLLHRGVALGVPDPQVEVVPAVSGHAPPRQQLFARKLRVGIVF